jgi:hypothetical protein
MKRLLIGMVMMSGGVLAATSGGTAVCTPTGYDGLTAALVNPGNLTGASVNATGCDVGVYYSGVEAKIQDSQVYGALYYGVLVHGDTTTTSVDIIDSNINTIGDSPLNGNQRGVAIYYRAFFSTGSATGRVSGNRISQYQKGGIVVNGPGSNVQVQNNEVIGEGPVGYIAQNGIQFGYGSSGSAMKNTVTGHSYTGASTVSGGIIVVGGPGYGPCPDGNPCAYTTGIQIVQNTVTGNDVGIFLTNLRADWGAPDDATNIKAVNNTISNANQTNGYCYQTAVSDVGNNDKIINNKISGVGYAAWGSCYAVAIDADVSFTNRPKVHANK